jgi:glycosyltransferase involved in cell wall biosynthesis
MLAILTTHPIQYQVPLWKELSRIRAVPFEVWYLSDHATKPSFDSEFKQTFSWDVDMLGGYPSRFLQTNSNHDVSRFSKLRLAESLRERLVTQNVKALWIQGWQVAAYWQAIWQAHSIGIPIWLRGESNDLAPSSVLKRPIKQAVLSHLFSKVSNFLYIGEANRRFYRRFGVRDDQLTPAYYCVDNDRFRRQAEELRPYRKQLRKAWNIPEDSFCVLFAGKLISKKRPFDVVSACAQLQTSMPHEQIHLLFAGSGDLAGKLREACAVRFDGDGSAPSTWPERLGDARPQASFTGFLNQTEISKAYVAADCLVLPSNHLETWGLVVNEALASGLNCIVSNACGCAEDLIKPLNPAFCFQMGDVSSLSKSLVAVIRQPLPDSLLGQHVNNYDLLWSAKSVSGLYDLIERQAALNRTSIGCLL